MDNNSSMSSAENAEPSRGKLGLRILLGIIAILALLVIVAGYVAFAPLPHYEHANIPERHVVATADRIARGKVIATVRCLVCHVDPSTGRATGRPLDDVSSSLAKAYSVNITADRASGIGAWTDGELAHMLRTGIGRDGRLLPPWMPRLTRLSDEDLDALIAFLRSDDPAMQAMATPNIASSYGMLGKALMHFAWSADTFPRTPIVAPPTTDALAYGRYLVRDLAECWSCHSANFRKLNQAIPERSKGYLAGGNRMAGSDDIQIITPNLTPDTATGLGQWSGEQFNRALRFGVRPNGAAVRYPMPRYGGFSDGEVAAMFTYLRSVAPVHSASSAMQPVASESGAPSAAAETKGGTAMSGQDIYGKYGCSSCHGDAGVALADLRKATRDFPTDRELEAFIRHPSEVRPGISMPSFDHIIRDEEFPALLRYVRELCARPGN